MVTKIMKLTAEQHAAMKPWAKLWIDIGLCTEPADRETAEQALARCYQHVGLQPPKRYVWVDSPIVAAFAGPIASLLLSTRRSVDGAVRDAVVGTVDDAVRDAVVGTVDDAVGVAVGVAVDDAVRGAVDDAVVGTVRDAVVGTVGVAVDDAVGDAVGVAVGVAVDDAVGVAVDDAVGVAVGVAVRGAWWRYLGGQFWAGWAACERFFAEVCGLELADGLSARGADSAALTRSCGWIWPHTDFAIMTERPLRISRDESGRLHHLSKPAIEFRDGWGVYAVHGTRIPDEWITARDTIDPRLALTHENIEQRRVLRDHIIGWPAVIAAVGGEIIVDQDADPEIGTLIQVDLGEEREPYARFLRMRCGTGRTFIERVHPDCTTAMAAQEWRWQLASGKYHPEIRT